MRANGVIRRFFSILFLGASLLATPMGQAKNIVFDLNGVLLETDHSAARRQAFDGKFLNMGWFAIDNLLHLQNPFTARKRLENLLFKTLDAVLPFEERPHGLQPHHRGRLMPEVMRIWLRGTAENKEILSETLAAMDDPCNRGLFVSKTERKIVANIIRSIFDPAAFAQTRKIIPAGYQLACDCYNELDEFGNRKHKLYVLSNWDAESIEYVAARFPELFELFDGIMISGWAGEIKPFDNIYKKLIKEFNLNPKQCIFLDDEEENIIAGRKHFKDKKGQRCIHCPGGLDKNPQLVADVREQLQKLDVISV